MSDFSALLVNSLVVLGTGAVIGIGAGIDTDFFNLS